MELHLSGKNRFVKYNKLIDVELCDENKSCPDIDKFSIRAGDQQVKIMTTREISLNGEYLIELSISYKELIYLLTESFGDLRLRDLVVALNQGNGEIAI